MTIPEEEDFDAILEILRQAGVHELKSILRVVGEDDITIKAGKPERGTLLYSRWQGDALKKGVEILKDFRQNLTKKTRNNYLQNLGEILDDANIVV